MHEIKRKCGGVLFAFTQPKPSLTAMEVHPSKGLTRQEISERALVKKRAEVEKQKQKLQAGWVTYLEVHGTYNLLSNCSYNPIIFRVTVVMGLIVGL